MGHVFFRKVSLILTFFRSLFSNKFQCLPIIPSQLQKKDYSSGQNIDVDGSAWLDAGWELLLACPVLCSPHLDFVLHIIFQSFLSWARGLVSLCPEAERDIGSIHIWLSVWLYLESF